MPEVMSKGVTNNQNQNQINKVETLNQNMNLTINLPENPDACVVSIQEIFSQLNKLDKDGINVSFSAVPANVIEDKSEN